MPFLDLLHGPEQLEHLDLGLAGSLESLPLPLRVAPELVPEPLNSEHHEAAWAWEASGEQSLSRLNLDSVLIHLSD